ncbi:PREDICTED: leucine-rich repeat receptor-like protein kinase TDR [Tarenaya hassleriana]|uniref:leucine-rich repeat receptor-like protein kinase TDR n=1 Tax=Tarenaya hassleriana TaxID=28532 RepID=UPI00053C873C|nr:PREDICTED: leucine-rich repeat receptor-like protein kinase TDR [Tarenaya hassleriana]
MNTNLYYPSLLLLPFFLFSGFVLSTKPKLPPELVSLISIKTSLKGSPSAFLDWDVATAAAADGDAVWCSWSGVECDNVTARVTSLDLSRRNLSGRVPDEIRYLSGLFHLNLSGNSLDGSFPTSVFELYKLMTLDISHNSFGSSFPPGISKLKFLRVLDAFSNNFDGRLPEEVARLRFLEVVNFGGSYFEGEIPPSYGGLQRLKFLNLAGNVLEGGLPPRLGFLPELQHMEIGYNQFTGSIPMEFSLLSNLKYLDVSNCSLSGTLTQELGNLSKLETLYLFDNNFSGEIPASYGNLRALKSLDLSSNQLSGSIPEGFSGLKELTWLSLISNNLTGEVPHGIGELPELSTLLLWNNNFTGALPEKLGSNGKLTVLDVSNNSFTGTVPPLLCHGNALFKLILFSNMFNGELPRSLTNCTSLWRLRIQNNRLNGSIPLGFGSLRNLTFVDLSNNRFSGEIPVDFAGAPVLQYLNLSSNSFHSRLPGNIWSAPSLQILTASFSDLIGEIPSYVGCKSFYRIELQGNSLNGTIPWDIGHCEKLLCLNLSRNSLSGIIPWEISTLPSIADVDLSHNLLTGTIPSDFGNSKTIMTFNVSHNLLTGPIPAGSFANLNPSFFSSNEGLCGDVLAKPCASGSAGDGEANLGGRRKEPQPKTTAGAIVWIMAAAMGIGFFVLVAATRCFKASYGGGIDGRRGGEIGPWKLTAFQRLNFTAEDVVECLSKTDNIIGMGSTGTVYKAEMPNGEIIAVKKLWGKNKENGKIRRRNGGALAEVEVLGNVRHRNIVRLLGCCSNRECTMLLYEYMRNGSLDELLHAGEKAAAAEWTALHRIAVGVAQGISYLHHDCEPVIVHRDLKPSNILLDSEMEARVADFGVAKLIQSDESMSVVAGSYGYIAPEYAYTLQVDKKSDIYSYGVILLEMITGKRSVDAEFGEGNSVVDWVRSKLKTKDGADDILDKSVGGSCHVVREEMKQMLRIALSCTNRNPTDRPPMRDVVMMLQEAKPKRKEVVGDGDGGLDEVCGDVVKCPKKIGSAC